MVERRYPVLIVLALWAMVATAAVSAAEPESRRYVPVGSVDVAELVPPPPTIGSPAFQEQMKIVMWLQRTRTPAQVEFVRKTLNVERFAPILGPLLFEVDGIELKHTIDAVIDEVRVEYDAIKAEYDVPRPFVVNDAVNPVGDARPVASYPSGHAIRAIVYARLLAEVFPERQTELMDLAYRVGYGRVVAGVHYPMDVLTGQRLGHAFAEVVVAQPAFKEAVSRIRG